MSNPPPSGPESDLPRAGEDSGPGDADPATGHAYLPLAPEDPPPSLRRKLLKAFLALLALAVVLVIKVVVFGDEARVAEVGDCIAASREVSAEVATDAEVEVVDCKSTEAAYAVVGKVPGVSNLDSTACDQYFKDGEQFVVYGSKSSTGEFLLCLLPRP